MPLKDRIVLVMGPTGAGKSTLIDIATNQRAQTGDHSWESSKAEIRSVKAAHPTEGYPVVFVDTPGFDHTSMSDMEVVTMIADWLLKAYKGDINIATILYLHRISDNRMSQSAMKNLRIFSSLCGQKAMPNVVIVTTMWGYIPKELGIRREQHLKREVWKDMLGNGCKVGRFEHTYESAWSIIGNLAAKNSGATLLIQEEMGNIGKSLNETRAGIDLKTATDNVPDSLLNMIRKGFSRLFGGRR